MVEVEELVTPLSEPVKLEDDKEYKLLGVRWYGEGVFHRETLLGNEIKAATLYQAIENAFVYNRLFGWKESFALVTSENADGLFSNEFPQFAVDETRVLPEYFMRFFLTPEVTALVGKASQGSTAVSRNRFKEEEFLRFEIPLPPLDVQREIVDRWHEAQENHKQALALSLKDADTIVTDVLHSAGIDVNAPRIGKRFFGCLLLNSNRWSVDFNRQLWDLGNLITSSKFACRPLADVAQVNPKASKDKQGGDTLVSFVPMEDVSEITGEVTHRQSKRWSEVSKGYTRFEEGDLIWAKITPCMQNGKSAVVTNLENGIGFGSTEFHVVRANSELVGARYLWLLLRLRSVLEAAQCYFTGSAGQQRVPADFLSGLHIPVPPIEVQNSIVDRALNAEKELEAQRQKLQSDLATARIEVENRILGRLQMP